jgi:hypothetical protein
LPESGSQVEHGKYGKVGSENVADTFCDLLHGIFINVRAHVELSEISHHPYP